MKIILPQVWKKMGDNEYANAKVLHKSLNTDIYKCAPNESILIEQVRNKLGEIIADNIMVMRTNEKEVKIIRDDLNFLRAHMKLVPKEAEAEIIAVTS